MCVHVGGCIILPSLEVVELKNLDMLYMYMLTCNIDIIYTHTNTICKIYLIYVKCESKCKVIITRKALESTNLHQASHFHTCNGVDPKLILQYFYWVCLSFYIACLVSNGEPCWSDCWMRWQIIDYDSNLETRDSRHLERAIWVVLIYCFWLTLNRRVCSSRFPWSVSGLWIHTLNEVWPAEKVVLRALAVQHQSRIFLGKPCIYMNIMVY